MGKRLFLCRFYKPKEWRPEGKHAVREWSKWIKVFKLTKYTTTCTYRTLTSWLRRTSGMSGTGSPVVCSIRRTGGLGVKQISKLAALGMRMAGIPSHFKPQSIRGAVASAAKDYGASTTEILDQGRWSDKGMFLKYYYRSIPRGIVKRDSSNLQARIRAGLG